MLAYSLSLVHSHILVSLAAREAVSGTILTVTVSRDNKQIKLHATYSRAYTLWGPAPVLLSYFKLFHSFQCPHINQKKLKAGKSSHIAPSHPPPSATAHYDCRSPAGKAESSPHSHILVSLAAREAVSVRIWYYFYHLEPVHI